MMGCSAGQNSFRWVLAFVATVTILILLTSMPYKRLVSPCAGTVPTGCISTEVTRPAVFHPPKRDCQFLQPFEIPGILSSKLCTYDPNADTVISKYIQETKAWEPEEVSSVLNIMGKDVAEHSTTSNQTSLSFVDVGCNIGVYSFSAAMKGYKVLAVDAMPESLQLLSTSLRLANLSSRVMLLNNAISDRHETVKFKVHGKNVGMSRIQQLNTQKNATDSWRKIIAVKAVCMDDLVPYVPTRRVFLKMDIESSEWLALRCADKFFRELDVPYFMMEWMHYFFENMELGEAILSYVEGMGYRPFHSHQTDKLLTYDTKNKDWPANVLFMKK